MSFFSKLFSSAASKLGPVNLSVLKTDVHSHLIPGIDDGAKTMEDAIALISELHQLGYQKVITTPHIMSDHYKNTPEIILSGLEKVRKAIKEAGIEIEIEAAAEYYLDYDFEIKIAQKQLLTFGKNYVLFELPFLSPPESLNKVVFELQTNGYKPILAHPERYAFWYKDFDKFYDLRDKGVLLQMNLNSLTGHYSIDTKKIAERMIDENMIDLLGTDCHNLNHIRLLHNCLTEKYLHKILQKEDLLNKEL